MTIDCSEVTHTSRHGLIALADITKALQKQHVRIAFTNMSDPVARMLHHTRFNIVADMGDYTLPSY